MLPSRAMNSKLAQARYGSWSGQRSRTKSRASRSQGYLDSVTVVQFFLLSLMAPPRPGRSPVRLLALPPPAAPARPADPPQDPLQVAPAVQPVVVDRVAELGDLPLPPPVP